MIRTVNVKEEVLGSMQIIGDLSYAWDLINRYVRSFQTLIKRYGACTAPQRPPQLGAHGMRPTPHAPRASLGHATADAGIPARSSSCAPCS